MSFDSLALHLVVHELHDTILNGQIRHVEQLDRQSITLKVSQKAETYRLLISAHPVQARTHLIERPLKGQEESHFANFLMKHITRGRIAAIEQIGWDRVLKITIELKTDVIESSPRSIIAEFMGKHSNIILIDEATGKILESIKHIDGTLSRYREILPGLHYTPPPRQEKLHPLTLNYEIVASLIENQKELNWRFLFNGIDGLSPTLAKEIIVRAGDSPTPNQLWEAYQQIIVPFNPVHSQPQVLIANSLCATSSDQDSSPADAVMSEPGATLGLLNDNNELVAVSALQLRQFPHTESIPFETMSEALSAYYDTIARVEAIKLERHTLNQVLDRLSVAIDRKLILLHKDLADSEKADDYRIKGELLTANLHCLKRGQTCVEVQNYYSPKLSPLKIELNPQRSPSENVQQYFKRYTKAKRGLSVINQLIADNKAEQEVLRAYALEVEKASTLEELLAIRSEFAKKGWIKSGKQGKKKGISETTFRKFTSLNGFQMYVGRNSKENDLLLRRIATARDMWLHAKQIHGSHVIIRNPENRPDIPMPTLLQAAQIAAFFSKARHTSYAPVDYTWARYVVKPKGSAPGFVTYTREKTLYVEPGLPQTPNVKHDV
jgi:predicted ribosome quality control (RQC) complex YloA/Tae2 family protein